MKGKLVETLDEIRTGVQAQTVASLGRALAGGTNGQPAQVPLPQPATVQDTIALSKEAREASQEVATLARETAEGERERRLEAEQRAQGSFQAGQDEAESRWSTILDVVQSNNGVVLELVKENANQRVATIESAHAATLQRIEGQVQQAIAAKDQVIAQKDQQIEQLTGAVQQLRQRKSVEDVLAEAIASGNTEHPILRGFLPRPPDDGDPNRVFQTGMAGVLVNKARAEAAAVQSRQQATDNLINKGVEVLGHVGNALRSGIAPPRHVTALGGTQAPAAVPPTGAGPATPVSVEPASTLPGMAAPPTGASFPAAGVSAPRGR